MSTPASRLRSPFENVTPVDFRRRTGSALSSSDDAPEMAKVIRDSLKSHLDVQTDTLRAAIEEQLVKTLAKWEAQIPLQESGPFDAVYIAQLQKDPLAPQDFAALAAFAHVTDLSDELSFNDGLDA